jgi:hypothetical protein
MTRKDVGHGPPGGDGRRGDRSAAVEAGQAVSRSRQFKVRQAANHREERIGVDYEVRQALPGHRMPGMTASYSHGGPEWYRKLRSAVKGLEKAYLLSNKLL